MTIVPITRDDLDNGEPGQAMYCPISRAMNRAGSPDIRIYHDGFLRHRSVPRHEPVHPYLGERINIIDNEGFGPPQRVDPFTVLDTGNELRLGPA